MKFRVSSHTDYIEPKSTYVAIAGSSCNGIDFVEQAIDLGATKIVLQNDQLLAHELIAKCKKKSIVTSSAFRDATVFRTEDIVATADVEMFFNDMRKRDF